MKSITQAFSDVIRYISQAMARIFSPNEKEPPNVGVQPFEGNPYNGSGLE